jgi:hypothetical protein
MVQSVAYFGGRVKGKNGFFLECGGRETAIAGERNGAVGTEKGTALGYRAGGAADFCR